MNVEMTVNGKKVKADTPPSLLLSDFLRENLNLTGTHVGCDTSQCGACVVHIDGVSMKSCTLLAVGVDGKSVTTKNLRLTGTVTSVLNDFNQQ